MVKGVGGGLNGLMERDGYCQMTSAGWGGVLY